MHQGQSNYPKFQMYEKTLSTTEMVCGALDVERHAEKRSESFQPFARD